MNNITIRKADERDAQTVCDFIKKIAEYEKMSDKVVVNTEDIKEMISEKSIEVIFAENNNVAVGFAIYNFYLLSTFSGRKVMYLEDIFIDENQRGNGIGKILMQTLCKTAKEKNCCKIEWKCLEWNKNSIKFYESIGAVADNGWLTFTLTENKFIK